MPKAPLHLTRMPEWRIVSGLAMPSKMPGYSYSLPAKDCVTGSKLRAVKGSTCSHCYAHKGRYIFPSVRQCLERRLASLDNLREWTEAMVRLIAETGADCFRWHDSGDLQSVEHLRAIVEIADRLPEIRFWLPTREFAMVREWLVTEHMFPSNLTVRFSAMLVGRSPIMSPEYAARGIQTSSVGANVGIICGARLRNNECGDCRACWDKNIPNIDYPLH